MELPELTGKKKEKIYTEGECSKNIQIHGAECCSCVENISSYLVLYYLQLLLVPLLTYLYMILQMQGPKVKIDSNKSIKHV